MDTLSYLGKGWIPKLELTGRLILPIGIVFGIIFKVLGFLEFTTVILVSFIIGATTESVSFL